MSNEPNSQETQVVNQAETPQAGNHADLPVSEAQNQGLTLEQALDALKKVRAEAAGYRTKLSTFEQAQQEAERAKLSKEEQLQAKIADLERAQADRDRIYQEAQVAYAVEKAATKIGIVDPDAAAKLLDLAQLEFNEDGKPKNAEKLLRDLIQAKPYLAGTPAVSPTNPATNHSQRGGIHTSQLADLDFYVKNEKAIKQAMRDGTLIKDS
jgi:hypothetical protein